MLADLRSALRALRRAPGFALAAACTLALGVAATTAVFGAVDAVLLRPLPIAAPGRVVAVVPHVGADDRGGSPAFLAAWGEGSRRLAALAAVRERDATLVGVGAGGPERLSGVAVSGRFFDVLGLPPARGRAIRPADDVPGAPSVVVLSHALWARAFGADPGVLGRTVRLDGTLHTVVGVMPPAYDAMPGAGTFLVPLALESSQRTNFTPYVSLVARLAPGATAADAARELDAITARLGAPALVDGVRQTARVVPLDRRLTDDYRRPLLLLLAAAALVLGIACANVATLVLARGTARAREFGVRAALGAGRARLLREQGGEHLVLGTAAAGVALPLAAAATRALVAFAPAGVPRLAGAGLDARAAAVAVALALGASLLSGVAPTLWGRGVDVRGALQGALQARARGTTDRAGDRSRRLLVGAEVALALALLTGAGLLLRSAAALGRVAPGYDVAHVLTARLAFPERDYPDLAHAVRQYEAAADAARRAPGVVAAALVSRVPLGGSGTFVDLAPDDRPLDRANTVNVALRITSPGYFGAMGIPLRAGRDLRASDDAGAADVVVVNAAFARRLGGPAAALGRFVRSDNGAFADKAGRPRRLQIVGVVGDVRDGGARSEPAPEFYAPLGQVSSEPWNYWIGREMVLVARTTGAPDAVAGALRGAVAGVDARVPLYDVRTTGARLREALAVERFSTWLLTLLGATGLVLVAFGVHAVVAYAAGQRAREVGVRLALGSTPAAAVRLVMGQGMRPVAAGLIVGVGLAFAVARGVERLLFGVSPLDPLSLLGAALVLAGAAAAACYGPARRVAALDPTLALRAE